LDSGPLGRPRRRWKDREVRFEDVSWIEWLRIVLNLQVLLSEFELFRDALL
jgi:hypothetical protein